MSTITATDSHEFRAPTSKPIGIATLRIWPAVVLTIAFWLFLIANHTLELSAATRFVSRMLGFAVAFLLFFGWWLSRSQIPWRDRLLGIEVTGRCGAMGLVLARDAISYLELLHSL